MYQVLKRQVQAAADHAEQAWDLARATRTQSQTQLEAWRRWKIRWRELDRAPAGDRALVVCAICHRYRDGRGHWEAMPLGLNGMLGAARGICVSHGLCTTCTSRALREVKHLPSPALAVASAAHD
jgi:hypothetical protein